MARKRNVHVCVECGAQFPRWSGRCSECGQWGTIAEEAVSLQTGRSGSAPASSAPTTPLHRLHQLDTDHAPRMGIGIAEMERVLGGGIVPGSLILLGGDPGIGKSTLTMQLAGQLSAAGQAVLYVSGEESAQQIKLRADRLQVNQEQIGLLCSTSVAQIEAQVRAHEPRLLVVDSIQTMISEDIESAAGTVSQVRHASSALARLAKELDLPVILIGHVTKDGNLAGPRVLEHLVDVVLSFEGDRTQTLRLLRGLKNRFGATDEVGVFRMEEQGLESVQNPSAMLLAEKPVNTPGSVATATLEGSRSLLVEIQALVSQSFFGNPVRSALGVDHSRVGMMVAVLEKRLGISIGSQDIYTNVVGGMRALEPATDLAIISALVSSFRNQPLGHGLLVFGEVGLSGEVRSVPQALKRVGEARSLGYRRFVMPSNNARSLQASAEESLYPVSSVEEMLEVLF